MNKKNFLIVCLLGILLVFAVGLVSCDNGVQEKGDKVQYPGALDNSDGILGWVWEQMGADDGGPGEVGGEEE